MNSQDLDQQWAAKNKELHEQTNQQYQGGGITRFLQNKMHDTEDKTNFYNNSVSDQNKALVDQSIDQANQFRNNLPGYESQLNTQIMGDAQRNIASQQRDIRRGANSRGFLYSGLRTSDEARSAGNISSEAAGQKAKSSTELQKMSSDLTNQASQMAQQRYQGDVTTAKQAYDVALQQYQDRMSNVSKFYGAVGAVGGAYLGNKAKNGG